MAQQGFYPDPFTRRMAYDQDGSIGFAIPDNTGIPGQLTQTQMTFLNDERGNVGYHVEAWNSGGVAAWVGIIFPEKRDLHGYFLKMNEGDNNSTLQVSSNTTNGADGDWVSIGGSVRSGTEVPGFRTGIQLLSQPDVKSIRVRITTGGLSEDNDLSAFHLYGVKSAGETPHRLDFCDHTGAELIIDHDFGDQPRNSERIWSPSTTWNQGSALYIKNRSSSKQANDVSVSFEVVNSSSDFTNFITLSLDNVTYGPLVNIASINPQELVGPIYVKHDATLTANLGLKAGRLRASVGEWL